MNNAKVFRKMKMEWKKLLWDLRRRYNRFRIQKAKDFDPKNNMNLV